MGSLPLMTEVLLCRLFELLEVTSFRVRELEAQLMEVLYPMAACVREDDLRNRCVDEEMKWICEILGVGWPEADRGANELSNGSRENSSSDISPIRDWMKGELLGRGSFGSVYESIADSSDDDGEEIVEQKRLNWVMLGERRQTAVLSKSSSFTTTNDDDCWSLATQMSDISPNKLSISLNDRFNPIVGDWVKGQLLGRGSFGSVYEGIADGGFFIAVKEVSLLDQGDQGRQSISQLEQEITLLSQFEHKNIVRYYGSAKDESNLYIFLELGTKGSLLSLYQNYDLPDSLVSLYTRQILHGLKYLHERNVVHRDIKCANILVHANGCVKLADFGLAKVTKLNDIKSFRGTFRWMAPEVVGQHAQGYGLPADIWSLGCTVLEMLTRQIPYADFEFMQALYQIGKGMLPPVPDSLSRDAQNFIFTCLQVNQNDRPTAADLLDHPYVRRPLTSSSGSSSPYNFC